MHQPQDISNVLIKELLQTIIRREVRTVNGGNIGSYLTFIKDGEGYNFYAFWHLSKITKNTMLR